MRAVLLLVPFVLLVGCGKGADSEAAFKSEMKSASAAAPIAGIAAAKAMNGRDAAEAPASQQAGGKLAALETPVATPRMIVRNAQLALRVTSVEDAERKVGEVARLLGGTVEGSQGSDLAGPSPSMNVTLRVPEGRFDDALRGLERLGTRLNKTISSEDVTAQAVDLDARVKSLRVQEEAYRAILSAARRIPDVLEIQQKLTDVRTQIEEIVAQRRGIGDQAARSTIVVSLSQVAPPSKTGPAPAEPNWLATTWGDATGSLFAAGRFLVSLAVWLLVMLPIWVPLCLLGFHAYRRVQKSVA